MSTGIANSLISHFFNIPFDKVEDLTIRQYEQLIELACNLASIYNQGEFKITDSYETSLQNENEYNYFKARGLL